MIPRKKEIYDPFRSALTSGYGRAEAERVANLRFLAERNSIAESKRKMELMPWNPSAKRTLGASEGISLFNESGKDIDRYQKIIKSDYEATRNKFGDYDERTKNLRNKLDQIEQFKYYKKEEPEWQKLINPPKPKINTKGMGITPSQMPEILWKRGS